MAQNPFGAPAMLEAADATQTDRQHASKTLKMTIAILILLFDWLICKCVLVSCYGSERLGDVPI